MMKKIFFTTSLLLIVVFSYAKHKDIYIDGKYGNIKTSVKTGFNNYGETIKVEIFGKLAQELSLKLNYKDTITIEFVHDYTNHSLPNLLIVENGDVTSDRIYIEHLEEIKEKQESRYANKNLKLGICIRVIDTKFDIKKHLKILEYCILNGIKNAFNKQLFKPDYSDGETIETQEIFYYGLQGDEIKNILIKPDSNTIKETLKKPILFTNESSAVKGIYENETYNFSINNLNYKTETLVYIIENNSYTFIFDKINEFTFLSKDVKAIKHFKAKSGGYSPYYTSVFNYFDEYKKLENNEILLFRANTDIWLIFSLKKNQIVK